MKNLKNLSLVSFLFITSLSLADTPPPGTVKAKMFSGDGTTAVTTTGGAMNVNVTNSLSSTVNQGNPGLTPWLVDGSGHTQPVSGTLTCNAGSGTLAVSGPLTDTELRASAVPVSGTFWQSTQPVSGTLTCDAGSGTFAVSGPLTDAQLRATAVPISGTITATNSANGNTGSAVPSQATMVGGTDGANLRALKVSSAGVLSVDGSATTQPISAATLPLPSGAATDASVVAITTALGSPFQAGGSIGNASFGISGTLPAFASTPTFNLGTLNGAATAANQTTANTSLASIVTNTANIPAQGQALAAGSMPVVLPAAQITTLTPPTTITANAGTGTFTVDASGHTVPVSQSGTWNITNVSGTVSLPTGAATSAKQPALGTAGSASSDVISVQGISGMTALKVDGSGVTQPVSGTVTANAGTGNFTVVQGTGTNLHTVVDSAPTTAVTQSGTWTVQPGNTANTTAWLVSSQAKTPTAVTVKQAAVTIGTSAVRLTNDGSAPPSTRALLVAQLLSSSTANCYLGASSVTSSSGTRGVQMFAGQSFSFTNDAGDYYAICDTPGQTFLITEQE